MVHTRILLLCFRMSSTPVSQLAAVFSSVTQPNSLPQSGPMQLSAACQHQSQAAPSAAQGTAVHLSSLPSPLSQSAPPGQLSKGTPVQLSKLSSSLSSPGSSCQLPQSVRLPLEPVPASELGLTITRSDSFLPPSFSPVFRILDVENYGNR